MYIRVKEKGKKAEILKSPSVLISILFSSAVILLPYVNLSGSHSH